MGNTLIFQFLYNNVHQCVIERPPRLSHKTVTTTPLLGDAFRNSSTPHRFRNHHRRLQHAELVTSWGLDLMPEM